MTKKSRYDYLNQIKKKEMQDYSLTIVALSL